MKLNLITFCSNTFSWMKLSDGMILVVEASDLAYRHLQPLYDDARDDGFAVRSNNTGEVVTYVMVSPFYRGDGEDTELAGWYYVPTTESCRDVPNCRGTTATIYND